MVVGEVLIFVLGKISRQGKSCSSLKLVGTFFLKENKPKQKKAREHFVYNGLNVEDTS